MRNIDFLHSYEFYDESADPYSNVYFFLKKSLIGYDVHSPIEWDFINNFITQKQQSKGKARLNLMIQFCIIGKKESKCEHICFGSSSLDAFLFAAKQNLLDLAFAFVTKSYIQRHRERFISSSNIVCFNCTNKTFVGISGLAFDAFNV